MFKNTITSLLLILFINSYAQEVITGKMVPQGKYTWAILYQLNGVSQKYIANTTLKDGTFTMTMPKNSAPGVYRLMYDNANNKYIDFLYNKEAIDFEFDPEFPNEIVTFTKSDENIIFQKYIDKIVDVHNSLDSLQVVNITLKNKDKKLTRTYNKKLALATTIQSSFEKESTGKLANHFIKANKRYFSKELLTNNASYLKSLNNHYFDYIDFNNSFLKKSAVLNERILNYVFLLNTSKDVTKQNELYENALNDIFTKITDIDFKKDVIESLLYTFAQKENTIMVKSMIEKHFNKLPVSLQDYEFKNAVLDMIKTTVGQKAPEISWTTKQGVSKSLYNLSGNEYYIVMFWSSTCGHCLKELPKLQKYLKNKPNVKVLAIGLETKESKYNWIEETYYYEEFMHIFGKNKYKNQYVRDYGVSSTPNFFLLDSNKKIIAKPYDVEKLKVYFTSIDK